MNTGFNASASSLYMKYKRTDLKWYQKLWNILTGHKDRNWKWVEVKGTSKGTWASIY